MTAGHGRMGRTDSLNSPRGLLFALLLAVAGLALAFLCLRTAMVRILPPASPGLARVAPHDPDVVLGKAMLALTQAGGRVGTQGLDDVRRAASRAPLDARPYLIAGRRQLAEDRTRAAIATLEAGQRLDPRQRFIHAFLLEEYLKTAQYDKAAMQFSVLARLVGPAQQPVAKAVALMFTVPEMQEPVRRTLRSDPALENTVLAMMATGDATPSVIFDLASPVGLAHAGDKDGWGSVLVSRLVEQGRFDAARAVWQRVFRLSDAQVAAPVFNPRFLPLSAAPPFNWTLVAGSLGAADPRNGSLLIDYYGRDSGDLANQLLLLRPGRYRFSFVVEGGKSDAASRLAWVLTCVTGTTGATTATTTATGAVLMTTPVVASPGVRRIAAVLVVPAGCPAQTLALHGEAGEFPIPVNTTLRDLAIAPVGGARP